MATASLLLLSMVDGELQGRGRAIGSSANPLEFSFHSAEFLTEQALDVKTIAAVYKLKKS